MTQILSFIVAHMAYLWEGARFRIVSSEVTTVNGGHAYLDIESSSLRIRFVRDRGQLFLDLQPRVGHDEWYSIDLIRRMFLGRREASAALDEAYAKFLEDNLSQIEAKFTPANWEATASELKKLRVRRAKEMFG